MKCAQLKEFTAVDQHVDIPAAPEQFRKQIEGNPVFLAELKKNLRPDIPIIEIDAHINDDKFAMVALEQLLEVMGEEN